MHVKYKVTLLTVNLFIEVSMHGQTNFSKIWFSKHQILYEDKLLHIPGSVADMSAPKNRQFVKCISSDGISLAMPYVTELLKC